MEKFLRTVGYLKDDPDSEQPTNQSSRRKLQCGTRPRCQKTTADDEAPVDRTLRLMWWWHQPSELVFIFVTVG